MQFKSCASTSSNVVENQVEHVDVMSWSRELSSTLNMLGPSRRRSCARQVSSMHSQLLGLGEHSVRRRCDVLTLDRCVTDLPVDVFVQYKRAKRSLVSASVSSTNKLAGELETSDLTRWFWEVSVVLLLASANSSLIAKTYASADCATTDCCAL